MIINMQRATLEQLFGINAVQNSQALTIYKDDLPDLTPMINNHAEALLAGLLLQASGVFEGTIVDKDGTIVIDPSGEKLTYDFRTLYEKLNVWFWKKQIVNQKRLDSFIVNVFLAYPSVANSELDLGQL